MKQNVKIDGALLERLRENKKQTGVTATRFIEQACEDRLSVRGTAGIKELLVKFHYSDYTKDLDGANKFLKEN